MAISGSFHLLGDAITTLNLVKEAVVNSFEPVPQTINLTLNGNGTHFSFTLARETVAEIVALAEKLQLDIDEVRAARKRLQI